jgi:hypothetical protein
MDRTLCGKKMPASKYRTNKHRLQASRTGDYRRSGSNQSFEGGVTANKIKLSQITAKQTFSIKYTRNVIDTKGWETGGFVSYGEVYNCEITDHEMILVGCRGLLATG